MTLKDFAGLIRAPFLILAPMCVLLGVATAYKEIGSLNLLQLLLVFVGGISAHIAVNSLNEYFDFKSGLDLKTIKTPFSGGSGTLVSKPELSIYALIIGIVSTFIVIFIGLYFVYLRGEAMLLIGITGLLMVILYPFLFVRNSFFALISPGIGFGISMVLGTHVALGGSIGLREVLVSLVPFFLVNNLLLLNQFPDKEPDESVHRRNIVIVFGRRGAAYIYSLFNFLAYLTILIGIFNGELNLLSSLGLLTLLFAIPASVIAIRYSDNLERILKAQGLNVIVNILTPLLIAIGILVG